MYFRHYKQTKFKAELPIFMTVGKELAHNLQTAKCCLMHQHRSLVFSQDTLAYGDVPSQQLCLTSLDYTSPRCDKDFLDNKPIFLHDTG